MGLNNKKLTFVSRLECIAYVYADKMLDRDNIGKEIECLNNSTLLLIIFHIHQMSFALLVLMKDLEVDHDLLSQTQIAA